MSMRLNSSQAWLREGMHTGRSHVSTEVEQDGCLHLCGLSCSCAGTRSLYFSHSLWLWSRVLGLPQEEVRRLQALCEAERASVPEEARRQLTDAEVALSQALDECRAALCQNRQVRGLHVRLLDVQGL